MPSTRYWTSYWKYDNWFVNPAGMPVRFSGGSFSRRGLEEGHLVYIVSINAGELLLGDRMTVDRIVTREEAIRIRGKSDLYQAPDWLIAREGSGTSLHHDRRVAVDVARQLRFISGRQGQTGTLHFIDEHRLSGQTLRVPRQLTVESAALLDDIIEQN